MRRADEPETHKKTTDRRTGGRRVAPTNGCTDRNCCSGKRPSGNLTGGRWSSVNEEKSSSKVLPRICIWESDGGDITCDFVDSVEATMLGRSSSVSCTSSSTYSSWSCSSNGANKLGFTPPMADRRLSLSKPGQTICKGHRNYELMLNLQLGIRYSVGKSSAMVMRELRPSDFDPKEKFWTRFPSEGSKFTPSHQSSEFRWKDYCPMVFRHLRKLFCVDPADYMLAICGNDALRELSSPGKSGSLFYLTQDDRFMIKTVKKSEVKVLIRMLPSYYKHVWRYENSLLTKFYGVHSVKPVSGTKVRFIVMGNLFWTDYTIHRRFDLKGSSYGRATDKLEREIDDTATLKDLDLNFVFRLQNFWHKKFMEQVKRDCEFLQSERIMDYSLLVGVHFRDEFSNNSKLGFSPFLSLPRVTGKRKSFQDSLNFPDFCFTDLLCPIRERIIDNRRPLIRLGINLPARTQSKSNLGSDLCSPNELKLFPSNLKGESTQEVILFFGIIDILQDYDISKKLEHAYKSFQADPNLISAVDPKLYSRRFRDFISRIFTVDD